LLDVAKLLEQHAIGCIVIEGDDGQVAGIVSERDLVWAIGKSGVPVVERGRLVGLVSIGDVVKMDAHRRSRHGGGGDEGVRSLAFGLTKHPG